MVRLSFADNDNLIIEQSMEPPAICLDHWATRNISEDRTTSNRFVREMLSIVVD